MQGKVGIVSIMHFVLCNNNAIISMDLNYKQLPEELLSRFPLFLYTRMMRKGWQNVDFAFHESVMTGKVHVYVNMILHH